MISMLMMDSGGRLRVALVEASQRLSVAFSDSMQFVGASDGVSGGGGESLNNDSGSESKKASNQVLGKKE